MADPDSLFIVDANAVIATELSRGPWDPRSCHGGPVAALLTRTCEQLEDGGTTTWQIARITIELVRPVPVLTPLFVTAAPERPGRNVSLLGARLTLEDDTEVARARVLRIRAADVELPDEYTPEPPFTEPGSGRHDDSQWSDGSVAFHRDSVDMRFADGSWEAPGAISLWCKLLHPLLPGEQPSGPQRAVAAADFGNGVSSELDPQQTLFINPDLSVHLLRPPEGEWIGLQARSHYGPAGAGIAEAALFDEHGRCGRSVQSLFVSPR